ncbi:hypothetical protein ACRAWF_28840 [Streptomyces sp. L7]
MPLTSTTISAPTAPPALDTPRAPAEVRDSPLCRRRDPLHRPLPRKEPPARTTSGARTGWVRPTQKCCTAKTAATTNSTPSAATFRRSSPHRVCTHTGIRSRRADPARSRQAPTPTPTARLSPTSGLPDIAEVSDVSGPCPPRRHRGPRSHGGPLASSAITGRQTPAQHPPSLPSGRIPGPPPTPPAPERPVPPPLARSPTPAVPLLVRRRGVPRVAGVRPPRPRRWARPRVGARRWRVRPSEDGARPGPLVAVAVCERDRSAMRRGSGILATSR